jgi:hypothetical protein
MARAHPNGGGIATAWSRRLCICWALFGALLMVMGLAGAGAAPARPQVECVDPAGAGTQGASVQVLASARLQIVRPDDARDAAPVDGPVHRVTDVRHPKGVRGHAYDATGPPIPGLSQPA